MIDSLTRAIAVALLVVAAILSLLASIAYLLAA
jgi:hypothetical protein